MPVATCPLCQEHSQLAFQAHGYPIWDCMKCGHRFASLTNQPVHAINHVEQVYDDDYFFGGGAGYSNYLAEEALLVRAGRRYARLIARWQSPGDMLDVGSAAGFLMQGFLDAHWHAQGVEPNDRMAAIGRAAGRDITTGPFEALTTDRQFDLITMIQVLAHFQDPVQALWQAHQLLKPGGYLLIETWDFRSRMASILSQRWHEYSPPSVLHWFSRRSLARLGNRLGLKPIHRGYPQKWIDLSHAWSLLRYKIGSSPAGAVMHTLERCLPRSMPIPYPSEDLFWMVFRKPTGTPATGMPAGG